MQNPIKKNRQSSIAFEKHGILFENLENLTSSNYPRVQLFQLEFCTRFPLTSVFKTVFEIFVVFFRSSVISKILKRPGFYTLAFYIFINNSRSKQNQKILSKLLQALLNRKYQQKISKSVVVGAHQSFQFFMTDYLVSQK